VQPVPAVDRSVRLPQSECTRCGRCYPRACVHVWVCACVFPSVCQRKQCWGQCEAPPIHIAALRHHVDRSSEHGHLRLRVYAHVSRALCV
jgi:hypothetical protein